MATLAQIEKALRAADAAGNVEDARKLAQAYVDVSRQIRAAKTPEQRYADAGIDPTTDPTEGMGSGQRIAAGFGKAFSDTGAGLQQAWQQVLGTQLGAVNRIADAAGLEVGGDLRRNASSALTGRLAQSQQRIDEQKRLDQPLRGTAGGKVGEAAGYLSQLLGPGLLARGSAAAPLLLPTTIRGMAAQGAALGSVQPVATGDSRAANTAIGGAAGAAGGLLAPVVGAMVRPLWRAATAPLRPFTRRGQEEIARRVLEGSASDASRLMTPALSAVPGVQRTLAEESLDPGIASLQRAVQQRSGSGAEYVTRRSANNDARVKAIQAFAGDDAAVRLAEQQRKAGTEPLLQQAMASTPRVDVAPVSALLEQSIQKNAPRPPVQSALRDVQSSLSAGGQDLESRYLTRKYIGDLLEGKAGSEKSYAQAATRELMQAKQSLDTQLAQASPEFGQYLSQYTQLSKPINRMQVGQTLLRDAQGSILDPVTHQYQITPAAFGRQVRNLDEAAQRATGFGEARAADILEPSDLRTIGAIEDDLSRQAFADNAARQGSDTFQKLMNEGNILSAMDELGVKIPGANLLGMLGKGGRERVNALLADVLANPARARQILAKAPATHRRVVQEYLSAAGGRLGVVLATESE